MHLVPNLYGRHITDFASGTVILAFLAGIGGGILLLC